MNHRLGIIEDEPSIRESIKLYTEAKTMIPIAGTWGSVEDFLGHSFNTDEPTILFLDIGLPGISGIDGIPHIKMKFPQVNIIILSTYEESDKIFDALCAGACSYISKRTPLDKIIEALNIVAGGGSYMSPSIARKVTTFFTKKPVKQKAYLTPRQKEIVELIVGGKTYNEIAEVCFISLNTVRSHIKKIYETLQINSKVSLVMKYKDGEV